MERVIELFIEIQKNVSDLEEALKNLKHRKCGTSYEDMEKYGLDYQGPIVRISSYNKK